MSEETKTKAAKAEVLAPPTETVVAYVGNQHWREISEADWTLLDVVQPTLRWDEENGRAVLKSEVSEAALSHLLQNEGDDFALIERPVPVTDEAPAGS